MSIMYYCVVKEKEKEFDPFNSKYDLLGYSKGFVDSNYWLLFAKEDEIQRGYCECSTEKCIKTIDRTIEYINKNYNNCKLNASALGYVDGIKRFLIDIKEILLTYPNDNIAFDFTDKTCYSLRDCFKEDDLKGLEIFANKVRLINTLKGNMNLIFEKKYHEEDLNEKLKNSLKELIEEINKTGIVFLDEYTSPSLINYPNNKTLIRSEFLLENKTNNVYNGIDILMSYFSSILKKHNASYHTNWSMKIPEKCKNKNIEYHMIELSIMN